MRRPTAFQRASLSQCAARGLIFAGRPFDDSLCGAGGELFEAACGADPLGLLWAQADLALALGCSGRSYWRRATELWSCLRANLERLAPNPRASILLQHIETDKLIAIASMCDDKALRASALQKAFVSGSRISTFLMRIVVELELLGNHDFCLVQV